MRALIRGAVCCATAIAAAFVATTPAHAATPRVEITTVYYDSPGSDNRSNASLNAEWVRLTSRRTFTVNLRGWSLRDRANHVYTFQSDFRLRPGATVVIHTGRGTNTSTHRYWGSGSYIWNNTGDRASLRNSSGTTVDACTWGDGRGYTRCG